MELTIQELHSVISSAVEAGVQAYIRDAEPRRDALTKAQAKVWMRRNGYSVAQLERWEQEGFIHSYKNGTSKTSRVLYSLAELKEVAAACEIKRNLNNHIL